mgnify:CR=1 FL=1
MRDFPAIRRFDSAGGFALRGSLMSIKHTFEPPQRKALASLGVTRVASAGMSTSTCLSDTEPLEDNMLTARELNLIANYDAGGDQGNVDTQEHGEYRARRRPPSVGGRVGPTLLGHSDTYSSS